MTTPTADVLDAPVLVAPISVLVPTSISALSGVPVYNQQNSFKNR